MPEILVPQQQQEEPQAQQQQQEEPQAQQQQQQFNPWRNKDFKPNIS